MSEYKEVPAPHGNDCTELTDLESGKGSHLNHLEETKDEENEDWCTKCINDITGRHPKTVRVVKWVLILILIYSFTIAARIINPEQSKILVGIIIFGTLCGFVYAVYCLVHKYCSCNLGQVLEEKCPRFKVALATITALLFAGLMAYFIYDCSDGKEYTRVRKAQALGGLFLYLLLCYICSKDRSKINWRTVFWGLGIQYVFAMLILRTKPGEMLFDFVGTQSAVFLNYAKTGGIMVFGKVAMEGAYEGDVKEEHRYGYSIWTFSVLIPVIVYFSAFISIMFHLGIMQTLIGGIGKLMSRTMQTSSVESLSAAANIFVGMTEAPLMIRPFIPKMTKSELHSVMTGGFATIAGGVLAAYIGMGISAKHLIAASVMSCPAALAIAKLVYPEREVSCYKNIDGDADTPVIEHSRNVVEAATNGASIAIMLCANIVVMLIAFLSFYDCFQAWFNYLALCVNVDVTFTEVIGYVFVPFAWMLGIEENQCQQAGELLALKVLINEYVAYAAMGKKMANGLINARTEVIMTYALCGFGNIGSMGIQLGALSVMAPSRKGDISKLVVRAMLAGTAACQMTACIAGILLDI